MAVRRTSFRGCVSKKKTRLGIFVEDNSVEFSRATNGV